MHQYMQGSELLCEQYSLTGVVGFDLPDKTFRVFAAIEGAAVGVAGSLVMLKAQARPHMRRPFKHGFQAAVDMDRFVACGWFSRTVLFLRGNSPVFQPATGGIGAAAPRAR